MGATLAPEGGSLVKDSFGEIHVARPVPNYAKIQESIIFEGDSGAAHNYRGGEAHNYRRQKSSVAVTVEGVTPDLAAGFDVPATSSDAPGGSPEP